MQTVILGAGGMLGRALGREFPEAERFTRAALDITDGAALRAALGPETRLVLNAAADTRVDAAESDPHHVLVNFVAVGALAAHCRKLDATLVHASTDYVFSGKGIRPYREDDPVDPVNAYGRAKLMGERRAFEEGLEVLVVRTSWVFGMGGVNFVDTILKRVEGGARDLSVVNDQVSRPTFAADLAAGIRRLVDRRVTGVVHFANAGDATWFELASEALAREGRTDVLVRPVPTSAFPRPARRPPWSVLDTSLYERLTGGVPRSWREALCDYLADRRAAAPARPAS
ncbi:MAG: dTDP-4-dehydrorhamnose reductase [Thermoanaerobaculia bacterium]|nr:dTDP-4-dehydrorhamnose reductase [Thermoanaerobaculia bacterium]